MGVELIILEPETTRSLLWGAHAIAAASMMTVLLFVDLQLLLGSGSSRRKAIMSHSKLILICVSACLASGILFLPAGSAGSATSWPFVAKIVLVIIGLGATTTIQFRIAARNTIFGTGWERPSRSVAAVSIASWMTILILSLGS